MNQYLTGRDLANNLANHLRSAGWLAYTEIKIPGTGGQVDVAAVKPHVYSQKDLRAYEVKISKSDFRSDEGKNKWRRYLQVFHRVYFAAPAGLLTIEDIPVDAGLIVLGNNGWHVVKAARGHNPPNLTADAVLSLLYRGYYEDRKIRRLTDRVILNENKAIEDRVKSLGWEIRRKLAGDKDTTDAKLQKLTELIEKLTLKPIDQWSDKMDDLEHVLNKAIAFQEQVDIIRDIGVFLESVGLPHSMHRKKEKQRKTIEKRVRRIVCNLKE